MITESRRAAIDVATPILPRVNEYLEANGLRVVASLDSPPHLRDTVRLMIEGERLPADCDRRLFMVSLIMRHRKYHAAVIEDIVILSPVT